MRRMIFLALLSLTWSPPHGVRAQDTFPITPDPVLCVAEPIDIDRLVALLATPTPPVTPAPPTDVVRIASRSVQNELVDVVVAAVACTNANQPLRALSYFTEDYLLYAVSDEPAATLGHLRAAATRDPDVAAVEDRVTIEAIETVTTSSDRAEVVLLWSSGERSRVRTGLRFRDVDGGWKIYEVVT